LARIVCLDGCCLTTTRCPVPASQRRLLPEAAWAVHRLLMATFAWAFH
jgi:hypothetical protein